MPSKKVLSDKELAAWENSRDMAAELEQSIREMTRGKLKAVPVSVVSAVRMNAGLSQSRFALLLGVSVRTLQEWEQGRRQPSGAAKTLLAIANRHPEVFQEAAA